MTHIFQSVNSWIGTGCVPVMIGKFAMFWTYAFTISRVFPYSPIRIFFALLGLASK